LLLGAANYRSIDTLIVGRLIGKYYRYKKLCKNRGFINLYGGGIDLLTLVF